MSGSLRGFALGFLLMAVLALFVTALYQRMVSPSLTQVLDMPDNRADATPERGTMPKGAEEPAPGQAPLPLADADSATLGALMARLREMPGNADVLLDIAAIFARNKDWDKTVGFLKRAAGAAPSDLRPPYFLGVALADSGDYAGAAASFENALLLQPGNASVQFNLAILYRHHLNQPDKARAMLQAIIASSTAQEAVKARARHELAEMQ